MPTEAPLRSSALTVVVALSATAAGTCALYFRRTQRHLNNNNNNNNAIVRNNAEPTCAHTRHQTKSTFPSSGTSLSHSSNMMEGTAPPTNATPLADKLADGGDEGGSASTLASSLGGVPLATSSALPPLLSSAAIRSVLPPLHDGPFQFSTRSRPTEMSDGRWAPGGWLGRLRRSVLCGLHVGGSFSGSPSSSTHTSKQHDGGAKNNVHGGSSSPRRPIDARCRRQFMRNPPPPEMRVPPSCGSSSSSGNEPDEEELGSIDPNTVAGCLREADGAAAGGALGSSTTSAPLPPTGSGEGGPWPRVRGLHFVVCVSRCVLHRTQAALFVVMPQAIQRAAMRMVKSLRAFSYRRSSVAPQEASLPISARLERALRPLCPTSPDCVPTVVLLRVPMGVEVSADVEALWAAMQQDSCAWEDGLVDIVVVEEAPNVEESATRPTFSDESLQWVGAGTSDRSITMAASAATVPPLPSMEELPSGDRRAGEATEEACGGRTTTRRLSEVGKGDELSFELFPAYRFYLDLFRAAALQEKDEAVKEALGSMPRRCPFSPTVSCDRCAPKSSIVLSPFSPNVPMFSSAVWSSSPVLMEREFCTRTIAAIDCPCGWDIRGCGEVPVQVTHRFRLWRQGSRSVAPLARAEEILRPLRAMWAKQTAAVLERGRDEEPASPSTSKAAAPSSPNSAGPAGASPPIVLTSPSISEVMVGNLLPSTREADAEALAFGLTQGLTRREEMRRTLFCTLATYVGYRLCAIPLPDRRVYRILPPGVPREVAAFARGFRLHHSSAEALLTQQRTLECILLRLESRHLRSKCERQTSAGGGEMDAADAGLFPRQTSEPPSGSGGLHSSGAASPSSWALSTLGRRAGQEPSSFDERYSPEWSLMHRAEESATYGGSLSAEPGTSSRSRPSNNPNSAVPTTRWIATNTSTNNAAHASLKATMGATTTESLASNCSSGPPAVSNASVAESSVDLPRAPRGSMYGIYDAYYGHSITTPQSLLFRHRMANWHQLHRRSFHSAAPSESVHTGRLHPYSPNASLTSISDLSFTASSQHQCLAGYYGRWGPCLSEELMQLRPLPLGLGRMDASTSAISGSPTGLMMMSDEAHFASACDPFYSNHPPRDHPCLRYVPDVMRFLLAAERGTAWTGTRFFYAFGDATASLYNASLQMKVEAEGWLHTPKYVAPPPSPQLVHVMEQPPAPPSPPPVPRYPGAHLDAGVEDGSSYLFSTTIMDEEERVEEQQRQLRLCRNEPFVPLFHHIHESFFRSVLREPFFGSPSCVLGSTPHIAQPAAGRGEGGGWGRWVASALGGGWTSSLSTATSPRRTSSSPTSAAANNVAGQVGESEVLRFGGQVRLRRDLDMKNGNFGLSPLEVWLACRYSRRVAAEVYLMDVAAAGRDPFFPTVRVVDEVVLHAVLYYHNRCLRDFVNELKNEFDLHYEPHTAWGRRCLSGNPTVPPPNEPTRPADNTPATPTTTTSEESPSPSPAAAPPMEEPAASPGSSASEGLGSFANPSPGAMLLPLAELPWAVSQSGTLTMDSGIAPPPFAGTLHHDAEEDQCILQGNMPPLPPWLDLFDDQQERHLLCELEYLKEFLIEHRHTLSSAVLTPHGCNRLEGVFGTPATVFPFLLCARESVSLVRSMYDSLIDHYGLLRFESFAQFTRDAFGRDRPEILRHSPRIFRTLNPSHRGYITYDELCCWIARKLSCGGNVKPDAHLAATSMSLRLPMGLLLDRKEHWQRLECSLASLSDTEGETF